MPEVFKGPVIIIGNPRSGTTVFRLMLSSHSELMIAPECGFMVWWYEKYKDWNSDANAIRLDEFVEDLFNSRRFEFWKLSKENVKSSIHAEQPNSYAQLITLVYKNYLTSIGKPEAIWGDKNNHYLNHIDSIYEIYPNAKFIHIVRDGRDVATSYLKLGELKDKVKLAPNLPTEIEEIASDWSKNISTIRNSFSEIPAKNTFELKYEDLVGQPEKTLSEVMDFLGLEFQQQMLAFNEFNKEKELVPKEYMTWKSDTFEKIHTNAISKYLAIFSEDQIQRFEEIANDELQCYGYI